jgi:hypothetical protein
MQEVTGSIPAEPTILQIRKGSWLSWLKRCVHIAEIIRSTRIEPTIKEYFMLDEFDIPNVDDAVTDYADSATEESWERIKKELMDLRAGVLDLANGIEGSDKTGFPWSSKMIVNRLRQLC